MGVKRNYWRLDYMSHTKSMSYPLQKAHLLKLRAGVGQALQSVGQIVVCCKVETVCMKHIVDHGQKGLVVLHLKHQ